MSTEHMHVTNSRVFNNNKKVARNCVQLNTEWNETRVNVNVSNLYTATGDYFCFVLCYALLGECVSVFFPFSFFLPLLVLPYFFFEEW